jgi:site-specific recombinase XerD
MLTVSAETRGAMVAYTFGGVNIAPEVAPPPPQTRNEERLIELWLHQRSEHTRRAYLADIARFRAFIACRPLGTVTLDELEQFAQTLEHMAPRSQCRILASVKSLFSYAAQLRYMQYDAARPLRLPKIPCDLAKRILDEEQVVKMISLETKPRNAAMLRLFYSAGLRVSELCSLRWRDLQPRGESGQVVVTGKGTKTRSVLVSPSTWAALEGIRGEDWT